MAETVVIIFVTLLLLLGIIQFALIYNAKTTLTYAAFEAARAGAVNYADRNSIEFALARGLAPLYTSIESSDSILDNVDSVKVARDRVLAEIKAGDYACIERINPTSTAFDAHGIDDPTELFDNKIIPNDNLHYRSALPQGGVSIQDANLLKLRITYCYPMYVPIIANTIKRLMGLMADPDPIPNWVAPSVGDFRTQCYLDNRFPIVAQGIARMQTPAWNDTFETTCN
ncbi:MAG: pilus assembly protein [Gammaproteobacteria bacterium]|nr:pilus assembly protein [Gammaproteobacteria bacterium]